ncbi:MAG: hypothetical protein JO100_06930 [Pseudonocardia sp.]|nr:hypothetical protein [Pseudonocardia sp.]
MGDGEQLFRIQALAGGDPLREERLSRSLRDALVGLDGVTADLAIEREKHREKHLGGSKGATVADLSLLVAVAVSAKPAWELLTTAVKEWCATERNRKVRITRGNDSIEIQGHPDEAQKRMVHEFLVAKQDDE